ncbi:MAG: aspartate aminotransferase family protein [Proteobacteria bacterium]|nr:aspartate aminotransferase family protein [Pseudomonadota bacterium]
MSRRRPTPLHPLVRSERVREAAQALVEAVQEEAADRVFEPAAYARAIAELERVRGRPLLAPALTSGVGRGARVWLADGTVKLDFVSGIGVHAFGHGERDLLETAVTAAATDVVFQGHLNPGPEYLRLSRLLQRAAGRRLRHVWLSVSGSDANENALKMIFQKHAPADRIVAFERGFHGRTAAMAEISDRPGFRDGQPLRGGVLYVPFYDPDDELSTERSVAALDQHLRRYPGRVAGMVFELIQGEGGFHTAPREFFAALMEHCKEKGIAIWVDEVQTFARTGELFAFQALGLQERVDVVTIGKAFQGSAVLYTKAYNPRPGLVAGTFAGSTVGMAVAARILERLESENYLGPDGRIAVLGRRIEKRFESLRKRMPRTVGPRSGMGAMHAFVPFDGSADLARAVLDAAWEEGLILLTAGSGLTKIRLLPPFNTTDEELEASFNMLEKALRRVAEERGLPC